MVEQNKLSVNLGNPLPDLNAHECLYVHQGDEQEALTICFKRTVRIVSFLPFASLEIAKIKKTPARRWHHLQSPSRPRQLPTLQCCSLQGNSPGEHDAQGRLLHACSWYVSLTIYPHLPKTSRQLAKKATDREALWMGFESTRPFAIKVLLGGVNAISGEPVIETFATALGRARLINEGNSIQDYAVVDPANYSQLWLDGIAEQNGRVMQFLGVRAGSGYSVEAQVTDRER